LEHATVGGFGHDDGEDCGGGVAIVASILNCRTLEAVSGFDLNFHLCLSLVCCSFLGPQDNQCGHKVKMKNDA
jgi:hypothetical protein